jgi:hypothetical protein
MGDQATLSHPEPDDLMGRGVQQQIVNEAELFRARHANHRSVLDLAKAHVILRRAIRTLY